MCTLFTRRNVRDLFLSKEQLESMAKVERLLRGYCAEAGVPPASVLVGGVVRYKRQGAYGLARVAAVVASGERLGLVLEGFPTPLPFDLTSSTNPLVCDALFHQVGAAELEGMLAAQRGTAEPPLEQVAREAWRLQVGRAWAADFLEACRQRGAAGLYRDLQDPASMSQWRAKLDSGARVAAGPSPAGTAGTAGTAGAAAAPAGSPLAPPYLAGRPPLEAAAITTSGSRPAAAAPAAAQQASRGGSAPTAEALSWHPQQEESSRSWDLPSVQPPWSPGLQWSQEEVEAAEPSVGGAASATAASSPACSTSPSSQHQGSEQPAPQAQQGSDSPGQPAAAPTLDYDSDDSYGLPPGFGPAAIALARRRREEQQQRQQQQGSGEAAQPPAPPKRLVLPQWSWQSSDAPSSTSPTESATAADSKSAGGAGNASSARHSAPPFSPLSPISEGPPSPVSERSLSRSHSALPSPPSLLGAPFQPSQGPSTSATSGVGGQGHAEAFTPSPGLSRPTAAPRSTTEPPPESGPAAAAVCVRGNEAGSGSLGESGRSGAGGRSSEQGQGVEQGSAVHPAAQPGSQPGSQGSPRQQSQPLPLQRRPNKRASPELSAAESKGAPTGRPPQGAPERVPPPPPPGLQQQLQAGQEGPAAKRGRPGDFGAWHGGYGGRRGGFAAGRGRSGRGRGPPHHQGRFPQPPPPPQRPQQQRPQYGRPYQPPVPRGGGPPPAGHRSDCNGRAVFFADEKRRGGQRAMDCGPPPPRHCRPGGFEPHAYRPGPCQQPGQGW